MWSFIKSVHEASINKKRLSIGVMPWIGVLDLIKIEDKLPKDFPKMHYLAVEGMSYGHHVGLFGELADFCLLLGGRKGAFLEASAVRRHEKPVICYDIESGSEAIATLEGETIVLPTIDDIVGFLNTNLTPDQRHFKGKIVFDFKQFDRYLISQGIVNVGFVSTSGAFTNFPSFKNLLSNLLRRGIPEDIAHKVEFTSGGTRFGGVWEIYNTLKDLNIKRNGIMSGKGLTLPWADVDKMVYVGDNWGDESPNFLYTSDILLAYSGGDQAKEEIKKAAIQGGRYASLEGGIPVIVLYDKRAGGATWDLHKSGYKHPNIHYFHTSKLDKAVDFLQTELHKAHKGK